MNIRLINYGEYGVLQLDGRLDSVTSDEAGEIFDDVAGRFDRIVLDLQDLEYISSSGLRIVKKLHTDLKKKDGELSIRNACRTVMEVFEMTGLVGLFKFI